MSQRDAAQQDGGPDRQPCTVVDEMFVPHLGWLAYEQHDDVARFLHEGWYEYKERAFCWLYFREGDIFIDCGAHFGLYSVLAARATGGRLQMISVEPNGNTVPILKANLETCGVSASMVVPLALFSSTGTVRFRAREQSKSAYSGINQQNEGGQEVEVSATTLDALLRDYQIQSATAVKIDVEGAEIEVLKGSRKALEIGALPVLMIEFTEANMQRFGLTTKDLFAEIESHGYTICRFDDREMQLVQQLYLGPVWYDNYFAVLDLDFVNRRLKDASAPKKRIARDILTHGRICNSIRSIELMKRMDEAEKRADEANRRADEAAHRLDEAYKKTGEANWRADEAHQRALAAAQQLEDAYKKIGEANWRADEAHQRALAAAQQLEDAYKKIGEANWRADEAHQRAQEAGRHRDEAYARAEEAWCVARQAQEAQNRNAETSRHDIFALSHSLTESLQFNAVLQDRMRELVSSRYQRLGWKLGFVHKPRWLLDPKDDPPRSRE